MCETRPSVELDADDLRARAELARQIRNAIKDRDLSQSKAAAGLR